MCVCVCVFVSVATLWHTLQQQIVVKLSEFIAINYAAEEVRERNPQHETHCQKGPERCA